MKTIREVIAGALPQAFRTPAAGWFKPLLAAALACAACAAHAAPANDNFASATAISGLSGTTNGDNTAATLQTAICEPLTVNCNDDGPQYITNSVWFAWTAPASGPVEFDTIGSTFNTVLAVYTSPSATTLCSASLVTADDDNGGLADGNSDQTSLVEFNATMGTTYYISVNSWDDDTYTAQGGFGPYTLNWNPAPPNDNFANAWALNGTSGTTNGNNTLATLENCETNSLSTYNGDGSLQQNNDDVTNSVWFSFTAPADGLLEVDTAGSTFETIVSAWSTPSDLCDPGLTFITAYDSYYNTTNGYEAQVLVPVVSGTTYYISLDSYYGGSLVSGEGNYVLNWYFTNTPVVNVPTLVSGPFSFTANTYTVSQSDSTGPNTIFDGNTVNPSLLGARVTVTRPTPAYGRVLVDYAVTDSTMYQNILTTNYWGTNVTAIIIAPVFTNVITGTAPNTVTNTFVSWPTTNNFIIYSNSYTTNLVINNYYQSYNRGYGYQVFFEVLTNSATAEDSGVTSFVIAPVAGPLASLPTNFPFLLNYSVSSTYSAGGGFNITADTNVFGVLENGRRSRGTDPGDNTQTITNNGIVYTNFAVLFTNTPVTNLFGTNLIISYNSTTFDGPLFSTNYYTTNEVDGYAFTTNYVYTNGTLVFDVYDLGTNWDAADGTTSTGEFVLNSTNAFVLSSPLIPEIPPPTFTPPAGSGLVGAGVSFDANTNEIIMATNWYSYGVTNITTVASGVGITHATGTITFNNFQMSQDILVPVSDPGFTGPDAPAVTAVSGLATITLSNPRLDTNEDAGVVIAPAIIGGSAQINALSPDYNPDVFPAYTNAPDWFNFERSTFRVNKNVSGGNAVISVYRNGTNIVNTTETVDYIIDPAKTAANYPYGYSPANGLPSQDQDPITLEQSFQNGVANSFTLQAGSDYATPTSDFTSVSGTLIFGPEVNVQTISIPITDNGSVEQDEDFLVQLHNPLPLPAVTPPGATLGEINSATVTILPLAYGANGVTEEPAGALDVAWNAEGSTASIPPDLNYPGTTPGLGSEVYAIAEDALGNAVIAGSFISYDSTPYNRIVRVTGDGYLDPNFQGNRSDLGNNSGANDFIAALAIQPDGHIIVAGNFTAFDGFNRHYIARLNSDGSVDSSFNPGLGANGTIWSIALEEPSGQIVIGGEFTSYNGNNVNEVARLNPDGSLDTTFNPSSGPDGPVYAVAVDPSQNVVIGGGFANVQGNASGGVARLTPAGLLDTTFTPGIGTFNPETQVTDPIDAVAVDSSGRILIGGSFANYDLVSYSGLARLNTDGTLDLNFHSGTGTSNEVTGVADTVNTIVLDQKGNILIGGNFEFYNQTRRVGLARVLPDGSLDTSFMDTTFNQYAGVPNFYENADYVATAYPYYNTRNAIYAIAPETSPLTSSNIVVGGTFEFMGGGANRTAFHPRSNVARVIGGSTSGPGNIELMYGNYSVNNSDGSLYVSLLRTNTPYAGAWGDIAATLNVVTAAPGAGIATAGLDFSPAIFNPEWVTTWSLSPGASWMVEPGEYGPNFGEIPGVNPASGAASINLDVFNPGNITGNLSANFQLSDPVSTFTLGGEYIPIGAALGAQTASPLTIIDSNVKPGVLGFSSPAYSVIENGSSATITVTRTNGSAGIVTIFYATSNGTATNGVDYTGVTNSIQLGAGVTNATFTVVTKGHYTSVQPDKAVNLRLFTPSGGATLGLTNAILTLINPNYAPGHLSFSATNYAVNENGGYTVVTVNRLGGSATTLGATLMTLNGSAISGTNYIGTTNFLFWNSGSATPTNIIIPVMDDHIVTTNLVAFLQLTNSQVNGTNNPEPLAFGGTNAILTVNNVDSAGDFQFSAATYSVKKYAGYVLVPVTRVGGSIGTVTVNFTTLDGTATNGVDYTGYTNTLTFTNGQLSQLLYIPVLPTTNGLRNFYVQLSTNGLVTQAGLGSPTNSPVYIIDSDTVNEPPGTGDTTYSSTAGFNGNVYALQLEPNNQLLVGGDFTMANGVVRNHVARLNSDGTLDSGFSLPTDNYGADDSVRALALETDGRILVGGYFTNFNGVACSHIARLNSDGTLDSQFNPGAGADNPVYAVAETTVNGNPMILVAGGFATFNGTTFNGIGRLGYSGTPDGTFNAGGEGANATVYAMAVQPDGKIIIGGDFTTYNGSTNFNHLARLNTDGSVDTNFLLSAAGPNASVRTIALQLDGRILIGGLFTNVNGTALNYIARLNADGSVDTSFNCPLGANDAVFSIALQSDTRIMLGGEFTQFGGVTRSRVTRLNPDGTIDPSINFGTGANNFVAAIAVEEDTIEGYPTNVPDEKIILGGGFTLYNGATNDYLVRIFGGSIGGSGAFQFSTPSYFVNEDGTNALITVLRTGGTTNAPTGDVFVTAYTGNGTATAANYVSVTTNLDFPLGEVVKSFVVPVKDDSVVTPNLTVNLAITNPTAPAEIGNQPTAVLTIINDDSTVNFSSSTYQVPKNIVSGVAAINIIRNGGTNSTATVIFATTGGTAAVGTDYTPVNEMVTFNPGVTNVVVDISINNNGIPEGNKTITNLLYDATGTVLVPPTNSVLTIIDTVNAPGELSFTTATTNITEGGGVGTTNVYVTIQRTFGSSGTISVGYTTQDGTATGGFKYLPTNGIVSFADGETSKTIFVPVINTTTAEGPETFSIYLFNPSGGATLTSPTNIVVTILNINTGIAFALAANAFTEPNTVINGTMLLNVIRYNNTNGTTTVNYTTTNGTAISGINYVGVTNGTITFAPGDSVQSIPISTIYDPEVTGDLLFTVGLFNPSGGAQLTPPSYTVVTDHDANAGIFFLTNAATAYRNAGSVSLLVLCSNTNVEPVSVNYATGAGSAVPGTDYQATSGTLIFSNGLSFNTITVPILLNNSVQSNRTFNVTLSNPTQPAGVLLQPSTETVTIVGTNTPAGLSFATPIIISGFWGATNANNSLSVAEPGDPPIAGQPAEAPVWFEWTAPPGGDGEVTLDTIGSATPSSIINTGNTGLGAAGSGTTIDTVLGVFTGTSPGNLNQLAANDDLFPVIESDGLADYQLNEDAQPIFNTNPVVTFSGYTIINNQINLTYFTNYSGSYSYNTYDFDTPFSGPSGLRFNTKAGTTYYIAVDTKGSSSSYYISNNVVIFNPAGRGNIQLSWAYHPAGVFRFASEAVDETGNLQTNGNPLIYYKCAETEGSLLGEAHGYQGPGNGNEPSTTLKAYYTYDVEGLLVTVTRVAGSSGRVSVDYSTVDGNTNFIHNGDVPAFAGTDYTPVQGTLIFDDFEMSKTIVIPITDRNTIDTGNSGINPLTGGPLNPSSLQNRDFMVVLSNPQRDPVESTIVSAPRVDPVFGQVECRILSTSIDPRGPSVLPVITTTVTAGVTNSVTNSVISDQFGDLLQPTNALFNFSKANYRVARDADAYWGANTPITLYVNRRGTNGTAVTLHYRFDTEYLDQSGPVDENNEFPLQPGSDYAVPTPPSTADITGTNSDFAGQGDDGTIAFPAFENNNSPYKSQPITFTVQDNHLTEFNKDFHVSIWEDDSHGNPVSDGMVAETTVTILFDDTAPPAGSVDELYNPDLASDLALLTNSLSLNTTVPNPGTDPEGDVYAVALTANNQAIIGGAFATYTDSTNTYTVDGIARLNPDGSLDPTFNNVGGHVGSGVSVVPAGQYIRSVALVVSNNVQTGILIGGSFTSYDGTRRNGVARLNVNGTLDTAFNPGAGANGTVWSVLSQTDGRILIGGEFTTYNGATANHVARLNPDGTLDSTFNASNLITGPIYSMALSPATPLNFSHSSTGSPNEDDQVINLGLQTSGTLFLNYTTPNTNVIQVYYGGNAAAGGTGALVYSNVNPDGTVNNGGFATIPFGPTAGVTTNIVTVVMNPGGWPYSGFDFWSYNVSMTGSLTLALGGNFGVTGQFFNNVARLNQDGTLDTTFNPGTGPDGSVFALGWQFNNQLVVGGAFDTVSGVPLNNITRLNNDGSLAPSFFNGIGSDNSVDSITIQPVTNLLYIGGPFTEVNGTHRLGFARLRTDGTVDTSFLDMAYNQFAGLPRALYVDPPGAVYASAVENDGNVIIGGSFQEVGGGQADKYVRADLETDEGLIPSSTNADLLVSEGGTQLEPKTRDGVRNRSNLARLIGGSTLGPGNVGLVSTSYAVNKTQNTEPVTLVRANGSLGFASANFAVLPGLAQSGSDYQYYSPAPMYPVSWEFNGPTRQHQDGDFGADGLMQNIYGQLIKYGATGPASVNVTILNNSASSGSVNGQFQMANPSQQDGFFLGGQDIPVGVALGISQTPLTLVDNSHEDGVFSFSSTNFVATNSPVILGITRTNGSFGTVQLSYQTVTNGSTAQVNVDYRATNGVITFAAGQTSGSVPITILNNSSSSTQEKDLNVQLYNIQDLSGGSAQLGLTNAIVRIINPNFQGYLTFSAPTFSGNIGYGAVTFTVQRTVGSKGSLTVQYGTMDETNHPRPYPLYAYNGTDYTGSTNILSWNNGDVSPRTVSIPLLGTNGVGGNKIFEVNLSNPTLNGVSAPALMGAISNATLEIINMNNYGTFQFSSASYQDNENGGNATITVTRTGSALGTATVAYSTVDGTALATTNYVHTANTLTFLPGQLSESFNVPLLDDHKVDPSPANFYFGVILSSPGQFALLGSPTNAQVHIVDAESYNQPPGAPDNSFGALVNASVQSLALQSDGQIVAGGSFTVADGSALNRVARFNTDGTLDSQFLSGLAGADGPVNAVLSQTDDRIVIGGSFANVNGLGCQGLARLMTNGIIDTSFNYGAGADNTVFSLAETFINGAREIYVGGAFSTFDTISSPGVVRLTDSGLVDPNFSVGGGANGPVYAVAAYPTNSVYNAGKVLVGGTFTNFNGVAVANLVRLNSDGSLDTNFNANVAFGSSVRALAIELDDSVVVGGDFTSFNTTSVGHIAHLNSDGTLDTAFNANATPGINGPVNAIALQADNRIMVGGQFSSDNGVTRNNITRLIPTGAVDPTINFGLGANGALNAVVVQPADGNSVIGGDFTQYNGQTHDYIARIFGGSVIGSGAFQFTSANYQIDEDAHFASITIERTGGTSGTNADGSGTVYAAFTTTTNGTAVAGVNYTPTTNYVAFPAGEVLETVPVPVREDFVVTPNLTVTMILTNPTPGTVIGDQPNAVLTIINDDSDVVFDNPSPTVPKNVVSGVANIQLDRVGSTSGSCTVDFLTTTNGSAVIGQDYYPTNVTVTFNPGDTNEIVQVEVIPNAITGEGPTTVDMSLTNAVNISLAAPSNAVLTILDTTKAPGNMFFTQTNFAANSSDGYAYLDVGRTNGSSGAISATYSIIPGGTAQAGLNYVAPAPGSVVSFSDGDTNETIKIQLINSPVAQSAVTLFVQLSSPVNGGLVAPTNTVLTINNTNPVFAFTLATNNTSETAGVASIVVQRFNNTNVVSSVNYATTNGTAASGYLPALAGVNYSNVSSTLVFGVGESLKSISVPIINRSNVMSLAFGMNLFDPTNGQLIAPSNTLVVISGSAAGISFTTNQTYLPKTTGVAFFNVVCSNPNVEPAGGSNNTLQVNYTTVDGTAKAGINYAASSGILVFSNGVATNTFPVTIFNNPPFGNLTFSVILTNVTTPGYIKPYGTNLVTITESQAGLSFSQSDYEVYKNSGVATITVNRSGFTNETVSVNYLVTNGTAINNQNFYATNGTLVFTNGVMSQTFNVQLIDNTQVQPNLFALMVLSNPSTNAQIVAPGSASLTILETGGSYVVPAGSQLLTNSSFADSSIGVIGSNDTVKVAFAFRDAAGQSVTNLVAYLLATNGVVSPSPASQQYGKLNVYGHSVTEPFSFTAHGTNGYPIYPTFMLYDSTTNTFIGSAVFTNMLGTWTMTFANTNMIIINDDAAASPYPSIIQVSGLGSSLVKATVTVTNLSDQSLGDVSALVVSPTTNTLIMGKAGGSGTIVKHITITFDDAATYGLPTNGVPVSGTNKPTQIYPVPNFP